MTPPPVQADTGRLSLPAVLVHGGAGTFDRIHEPADIEWLEEGLRNALSAGWEALAAGGGALEAAIEAVASLEDSGRFNSGRGSVPTSGGGYEFDASVMDAASGKVGAICAATWPANPVRVARAVAEVGGTPDGPVLLAGQGADRFAESQGFARMTPEMLAGARAFGGQTRGLGGTDQRGPGGGQPRSPEASTAGTVGAVAVDAAGNVAAATSTGGRSGQMPGRVGDAPIPGAGVWAAPGTAGVSATGAGEAFMVAGFCHRIDWAMRAGTDLATAMSQALDAVAALGGDGGAIAVAPDGTFSAGFNSRAMARGWRDAENEVARLFPSPA